MAAPDGFVKRLLRMEMQDRDYIMSMSATIADLRSQLARKDEGLQAAIKRMCTKCEEDDPLCGGRHDCDLIRALREPDGRKGE